MMDSRFAARAIGVGMVGTSALAAYLLAIRPRQFRWGATDEEVMRSMPGDDVVEHPTFNATRAVTVEAGREDIWHWLVQMGKNTAAFYSHTWAENLLGQNMHNADRIHPEWQNLKVGDTVSMGNMGPAKLELLVVQMIPDRALIFRWKQGDKLAGTWQFVLNPVGQTATRLLLRARARNTGFADRYIWGCGMGPISFCMDSGMMLGIKDRAERTWRTQGV